MFEGPGSTKASIRHIYIKNAKRAVKDSLSLMQLTHKTVT